MNYRISVRKLWQLMVCLFASCYEMIQEFVFEFRNDSYFPTCLVQFIFCFITAECPEYSRTVKKKWVWPESFTITGHRQPQRTRRKIHGQSHGSKITKINQLCLPQQDDCKTSKDTKIYITKQESTRTPWLNLCPRFCCC